MRKYIRYLKEKITKIEVGHMIKILGLLLIVLIFFMFLPIFIDDSKYKILLDLINIISGIIAIITIGIEVVILYKEFKGRSHYKYREYLISELNKDDSIDKIKSSHNVNRRKETQVNETTKEKNDNKDIIALMLKNHDEINEYFRISKSQAKVAFWLSVFACVFGLLVFLYGIYSAVALNNMQVTIISVISGAISELIAATVFWVHNKSALQLNHYYVALHENEKFLSAVNMADKLSDDNKEEMIMEIIRNQIYVQGK